MSKLVTWMSDRRFGDSADVKRFGAQAGSAMVRDHRSRARRRMIIRLLVTGVVAAGLAWGVLGVVYQDAPSAPPAAAAKTVAVADNSGRIVHVAVSAIEISGSGARASWSDDAWLGYPLGAGGLHGVTGFRQLLRHSGVSVQTGTFGDGLYSGVDDYLFQGTGLYDASTNTIYELPPVSQPPPFNQAKALPAAGCRDTAYGALFSGAPLAFTGSTIRVDRRLEANELAGGVYFGGPSARPFLPRAPIPSLWSPCTAEEVAINVRSGAAKLVGTTRVDGRHVIEFMATDGSWTYYADAHSDEPVRLEVRGIAGTEWPATPAAKRERATLTLDVRTYEQLPFRRYEKLLSLSAQHPGARIDTKAADYYAAQGRLFPRRRWG
jgi:hypothetical protein